MKHFGALALPGLAFIALSACAPDAEQARAGVPGEARDFTVLIGGTEIGAMAVEPTAAGYRVDFEYRNNGRGPTLAEEIELDSAGFPRAWRIEGHETFGNRVDESFQRTGETARWTDSTGEGSAEVETPSLYAPQNGSPYFLAIAGRALRADDDGVLPALPGGELRLSEMDRLSVSDGETSREVTAYALSGTSLNPTYFLMDGDAFFGVISPRHAVLEAGYEGEDQRLRDLAAEFGARRYQDIASRVRHDFGGPVRIDNVRIFDSHTGTLTGPASVVVEGERIAAIEAAGAPARPGEARIDGAGGTLVPGFFEMHGHLGETDALLNIAAGVTSVRDMGNDNAVLGALVEAIESGERAGPRVFRSGFIEGESPFNSNNGILVSSQDEAVAAVNTYADQGFERIKIYNSMDPDWIPAVIETARARGLHVMGHIPAFTDADAMIAAGYDELTHINQLMLGWVLEEGEDTRTLLRLTALKRLPELDLESEAVQSTIEAMVARDIAIDPTFAIHEALLLSRNGELSPGAVDYIDHMPVSAQRRARSAWAEIATPEDDAAYRGAFEAITEALAMMRERGIFMVPGTDLGGSFAYHRELELYQTIGMEPAEIVSWASLGMAEYLGAGDELGSIEEGKLADFFLVPGNPAEDLKAIKTISLVVADGSVYFPGEIYPEFGIRPFIEGPALERLP